MTAGSIVFSGIAVLLAGAATLLVFRRSRRKQARARYEVQLERALADGMLTADEIGELEAFRGEAALTEAEARMVALAQYRRLLRAAAEDARFTEAEQATLKTLQSQLGLSADDLAGDRDQLHRLWLLGQIERGKLPSVEAPFALGDGEICHFVVRGTSCGRTGVPSSRGEPLGIRFHVGGDAPFQVTGERETLESDPRILPMDIGSIAITDRRLVFRGARRRFAIPHIVLEGLVLYRDGIRLVIERSTPVHLLVEDPELTAAILLRAAGSRRFDVTGASPARTA